MNSTLHQYLEAGKSIAKARASSIWFETSKLLLHRAVTGYGPDHYIMYELFNKPVSFHNWRQYLDKRDFCQLLFRYNKKEHFKVLEDKVAFAAACRLHSLPHPEIVFTFNYDDHHQVFTNYDSIDIAKGFAQLALGNYIVKTCDGSYGLNLWSVEKYSDAIHVHNINQQISAEQFAERLVESKERYLVQEKIEVAPALRDIMPGLACGSMRIYTFHRPDGSVSLPYSLVKLPVIGQISDNLANGTSGNLSAIVNMENLSIQRVLIKGSDGLYREVSQHPDTGVDLRHYPIPELQQALELGLRCARAFPNIPAVGWDIVVTEQGAYVLEGNPMFDPYGLQRCAGRGAKAFVPQLLENP